MISVEVINGVLATWALESLGTGQETQIRNQFIGRLSSSLGGEESLCWSVITAFGGVKDNSVGRTLTAEASVFLSNSVALTVLEGQRLQRTMFSRLNGALCRAAERMSMEKPTQIVKEHKSATREFENGIGRLQCVKRLHRMRSSRVSSCRACEVHFWEGFGWRVCVGRSLPLSAGSNISLTRVSEATKNNVQSGEQLPGIGEILKRRPFGARATRSGIAAPRVKEHKSAARSSGGVWEESLVLVGRVLGTEASVFLLISVALAVFNLSKTLKDDVQSDEQLPGLVKQTQVPRIARALKLLRVDEKAYIA
ncbi:hypothetical protein CPB85DRAFT_1503219 [Mucidula mucida]|nr:hypothetical protein CPB85DRAFT_1503219 [Mucidula mucida]